MKKFCLPFIGLFFCLLTNSVFAQKTIYLRAGNVQTNNYLTVGVGKAKEYSNYAEISSLQFGIQAISSTQSPIGKPDLKDIIFTKSFDASSNKFMQAVTHNGVIPDIEILTTMTNESKIVVVHKIELKDVVITDISSSAVPGCLVNCPAVVESYTIAYRSIKTTTYTPLPTTSFYEVPMVIKQ